MSIEATIRNHCRLCGSSQLQLEISVPHSVIADKYFDTPNYQAEKYPLDLYQCSECGHIQSIDILPLDLLFDSGYTYKPSNNPDLIKHFNEYADLAENFLKHNSINNSIDIGSNDGLFLEALRARGFNVLGVEPASAAVKSAKSKSIPTIQDFFTYELSTKIVSEYGRFTHVSANNVYAHNDDLMGFTKGVSNLLQEGGIFTFEISYLVNIVSKALLGTIFHEHLSHHSLLPLIKFLEKYNLHLVDAWHVDTQGGAVVGVATKGSSDKERTERLNNLIKEEEILRTQSQAFVQLFRDNIGKLLRDFRANMNTLAPKANRIIGYGAARSANLLIEYLQIKDQIDCIVDNNPEKCGKYIGNSNIQIKQTNNFVFEEEDLIIPLAWVHSDKILKNLKTQSLKLDFLTIYPSVLHYKINY